MSFALTLYMLVGSGSSRKYKTKHLEPFGFRRKWTNFTPINNLKAVVNLLPVITWNYLGPRRGHVFRRRDASLISFDHVPMRLTFRIRLSPYLFRWTLLESFCVMSVVFSLYPPLSFCQHASENPVGVKSAEHKADIVYEVYCSSHFWARL